MADEGSLTVNLTVSNGEYSYARNLSMSFDQTNARGGNPGTVTITTSETTISFGSLTAPKYVLLKNLDDTNYVDVGPDSTGMVAAMRLQPGEIALFPLGSSVTLKAQANTASVDLLVEAQDA